MSKKQKTLFESWNKGSASSVPCTSNNNSHLTNRNVNSSLRFSGYNSAEHQSPSSQFQAARCTKKSDELGDPEFDYEAGKTWIYPTNYPIRAYQFSIVQEALYKNTLVVLPTGLGKTFIAAVVMYNIYRWFPNGKVVFMAPTKPLVAQQVNACFNITGISEEDTTQMTGTNVPELRKKLWQRKRVFFLTPQVLVNDLVSNICPASSIKCLVVDEAHKALGNHAYCQVIKELLSYTSHFRVLALTATPGSETQAVKQVLSNLLISHVELRSEDSEDVKQYTHIRDIEKIVVPLGVRLNNLKNKFLDVINVYLKRLILRKVMPYKNPASLSKFQVFSYRQEFSKNPPANIDSVTYGLAMADFSLCISLYHAYELLLLHGTTSFYNYLSGILSGDKSIPHARSELLKNCEFADIMQSVKEAYILDPTDQNTMANGQKDRKVLPSHPKLDKLLEVVLEHFQRAESSNITDTRVMIFTQYRDSVQEIVAKLNQYQPTVKVTSFVGQSSTSSANMGYTQKKQLEVIQKFRSGGYNTLVSTCVGEEGLDIGEVDLIVCFDCPKSPIRLVQRIGRTGRLRNGRIILLIAEGKEEQMFNTCESRKKTVFRAITKGFSFAQFYQNSPSLIPPGVKPVCLKTAVTVKPKKLVVKGASKIPFLTDEEMVEFNEHVKVPLRDAPLLPKQGLVIFSSGEKEETTTGGSDSNESAKPLLSLTDWTLWQSTPQRTDMIPHSSKSLLLVKTLELIHFPELLSSSKHNDLADFGSFLDKSVTTSEAHDLCAKSVLKQSKITEALSASKLAYEDEDIELISFSDVELWDEAVPKFKSNDSSERLPLIQQLFDITVPKVLKKVDCNLKSPPSTIQIFSTEDFSQACINSYFTEDSKTTSLLRILNKKMKAKLKRKSKELGKKVFCNDITQIFTPEKIVHSSPKSLKVDEKINPPPDMSLYTLHKPEKKQLQESQNELNGILFDIDFDLPDPFEEDLHLGINGVSHDINNESNQADNKKEVDSKYHHDQTSNINVMPVSPNRNEHTVLKNLREIEDKSFDINFEDDGEHFLLNVASSKDGEMLTSLADKKNGYSVKSITDDMNINISNIQAVNTVISPPEFSKTCNFDLSDANTIVSDFQKSSVGCLTSEISEGKRTNKYSDQQKTELNVNKRDDFKTILSKTNCNTTNSGFNIPSNNFKNRKLSLKETNEYNNICSVAVPKNSRDSDKKGVSFQFKPNETTEIYEHSFFDKLEENPNECNFDFDISFDDKNNEVESNSNSKVHDISSESTKVYSLHRNASFKDDLQEFDKDANTILEQLFTSQKNLSTDMNTSFSSPLTVRRCISESDKNESSLCRKKLCKPSASSCNLPNSSSQKANNHKFHSSETLKVPNLNNRTNHSEIKCPKDNLGKTVNLADTSQCTLTQLLSLIDCTEKIEKSSQEKLLNNKTNNLQEVYEIFDVSSDEEVCPTPPKEVIKPKSKFIYNRKSAAKKCLHFEAQSKLPPSICNRSHKTLFETSEDKKGMEVVEYDNFNSEGVEKLKCDRVKDTFVMPESELGGNEIVDSESCPKIMFDISFDLPFTQDNFQSSKDQDFDLNNAILIESSPSEGKLKSDPSNDFNKIIWSKNETQSNSHNEMPLNNVSIFSESSHKEDDLSDEHGEDSESLLPSIPINNDKILSQSHTNLSHNDKPSKDLPNRNPTCVKSLNNGQGLPEQSLKLAVVKEHLDPSTTHSYENCAVEKNEILRCLPSNEDVLNDFKSTIFFKILTDKFPDNPNSTSTDSKLSNIHKNQSETDFKTVKQSVSLCSNENFKEIKGTALNSNLLQPHSVTYYEHNNKCKSKNDDSREKDGLNSKCNEILWKDPVIMSELQAKDNAVKKSCHSNVNSNDPISMTFSEDKIFFDLSFDDNNDDKTWDILPKHNLDISENVCIISRKESDLEKEEKFDQDAIKNSLTFDESSTISLHRKDIRKEELKSVTKKSNFKQSESNDLILDKRLDKFSISNEEIMSEFDLCNEDQNFMLELEKEKHSPMSHIEQEPTIINVDVDNSSDEFDLQNLNQISMFKNPNPVFSKPASGKNTKFLNNSTSCEIRNKGKDQPCTSRNKLSSKLNVKNNKSSRTKIQKTSAIDDEEEDFLFIQKILKSIDKPSNSRSKKKKQLSSKNEFLLSQAAVSGSENSDHESAYDEDGDSLEGSFIDDESPHKFESTDQHAFYLKSIKNCVGLPQKFKLKSAECETIFPEHYEEHSVYQHDSFCVSDDEVAFLSSDASEDYSCEVTRKSKDKKVKVKNAKKKLKRIVTHDSTSSSDHEISPKIRKVNKETSHVADVPNEMNNYSFIDTKKKKRKLVLSSDEENENIFKKPNNTKCLENKNVLFHVDNINLKDKLVMPASDSINDNKFEFPVDFGDEDFLTLDDISKTKNIISTNLVNPPKKSILNNNVTSVSDFSSNRPSTSKAVDCEPICSFPSMSKPVNNNSFRSNAINDIETIFNDDKIADISYNIGWDDICPISNVIEDPSMNSGLKKKTHSETLKKDISETASIILVDSRELASGKPVISALRNIHKVNPVVMQLPSADYILSNRLAVERIFDSEFISGPFPQKVIEKIRAMDGIYEKSFVIIEKDNRKSSLSFSRDTTKYLKFVVYLNSHPSIQVLFSKSFEHTSELMANLIQRERRKGLHINVPVELNARSKMLYNFYSSIPKISPVSALNFMYYYRTVEQFLKSSVKDLEKKGCISSHKALSVFNFIQSKLTFHENM